MNCDEAREILLTTDLFTSDQVLAALEHLPECAGCREAMRDFDEISVILMSALKPHEVKHRPVQIKFEEA